MYNKDMLQRGAQGVMKVKSCVVQTAQWFVFLCHRSIKRQEVSYASQPRQRLDVYAKRIKSQGNTSKLRRAVIVIHGGGWISGDKRERTSFCTKLADQGYIVFSINYRLAPQSSFPEPVKDCLQALNWIASHAEEYGASPEHISIIGDSAGAHIASLIAADGDDVLHYGVDTGVARKHIDKLILYYGIYNLRTAWLVKRPFMHMYLRALTGEKDMEHFGQATQASPITYAAHFPSTLLIASEKDPLHVQTIELVQATQQTSGKYEILLLNKEKYPHANHGFQSLLNSKAGKDSLEALLVFLRK